MEENKYYTPEIEEFYIGFEYERNICQDGWVREVYKEDSKKCGIYSLQIENKDNTLEYLVNKQKLVKVKHLDKTDIESLGWVNPKKAVYTWYEREGMFDDGFASYGKWTKLRLIHCSVNKIKILAYEYSWDEQETVLFQGICKNKSKLKDIMEMTNIL